MHLLWAFFCPSLLCLLSGCQTLPALYLCEVAQDIIGTQADLHPPVQLLRKPQNAAPQLAASTTSSPPRVAAPNPAPPAPNPASRTADPVPHTTHDHTLSTFPPPNQTPADKATEFSDIDDLMLILDDYREFRYEPALVRAQQFAANATHTPRDRALAFILAGASAYILGNATLARELLHDAVRTAPDVQPSTRVFPSAVCRMHQEERQPYQ